jgi:hypothetical protein
MVRALAVSIIVVIVVSFTAIGNTQSIGSSQFGEGPEAISWEMYRQRQVEMQLEMQRQRLEMQQQQLEIQRQQLEIQRQRLEVQQQQHQLELEKQSIERQKKQVE